MKSIYIYCKSTFANYDAFLNDVDHSRGNETWDQPQFLVYLLIRRNAGVWIITSFQTMYGS